MYCAKCGKELEKDAKFCVNCGTAVNAKQGETETKKGDEVQTTPAVNSQNTNQNNKTNNYLTKIIHLLAYINQKLFIKLQIQKFLFFE